MKDRAYVKYAWIIPFALGIFWILIGASIAISPVPVELETFAKIAGLTWQEAQSEIPGMATYLTIVLTSVGQFLITFGILITAIAFIPYRRGERWAWYTMWLLPVTYTIVAARVYLFGGTGWPINLILLGIILIGLLLPYRKFFPKKS